MEEECLESDVDQIQVCIKECFVYQIPALRTSQGHRAEDWKLETPLFTGALRVYQRRNDLRVIVYREPPLSMQPTDDSPHSIFAECPISLNPTEGDMLRFVDGVIDSSRYFVLRVKDSKSERSTYIGVGFRERETAFEFRNCLNDYIRFVGRAHRAKAGAPRVDCEGAESSSGAPSVSAPSTKLALKDGERLTLKLGHGHGEREKRTPSAGSGAGFIPPPAYSPDAARQTSASSGDDDWGDFVAAT